MPDISEKTLTLAVQAVNAEIRRLREIDDDSLVPGDQDLLLQYELTGDELEGVYAEVAREAVNLLPYAHLVQRDDSRHPRCVRLAQSGRCKQSAIASRAR